MNAITLEKAPVEPLKVYGAKEAPFAYGGMLNIIMGPPVSLKTLALHKLTSLNPFLGALWLNYDSPVDGFGWKYDQGRIDWVQKYQQWVSTEKDGLNKQITASDSVCDMVDGTLSVRQRKINTDTLEDGLRSIDAKMVIIDSLGIHGLGNMP